MMQQVPCLLINHVNSTMIDTKAGYIYINVGTSLENSCDIVLVLSNEKSKKPLNESMEAFHLHFGLHV